MIFPNAQRSHTEYRIYVNKFIRALAVLRYQNQCCKHNTSIDIVVLYMNIYRVKTLPVHNNDRQRQRPRAGKMCPHKNIDYLRNLTSLAHLYLKSRGNFTFAFLVSQCRGLECVDFYIHSLNEISLDAWVWWMCLSSGMLKGTVCLKPDIFPFFGDRVATSAVVSVIRNWNLAWSFNWEYR
jgi:hypothetical protein